MSPYRITCRRERANRLHGSHRCRGFVALLRTRARVVRLIQHDDRAAQGNEVYACSRCGQLHEVHRTLESASPAA